MNIGEASKMSGVSAKMIRHYEGLGLMPKAPRSDGGYRFYGEKEIHMLRFIKRSRDFGFSMEEIKKLLGLWRNKKRSSSEVKKIAHQHVQDLEKKIKDLQSIANTLKHLAHCCQGDDRPSCPILEELGQGQEVHEH